MPLITRIFASSFKQTCVGTNGILEWKFLSEKKNRALKALLSNSCAPSISGIRSMDGSDTRQQLIKAPSLYSSPLSHSLNTLENHSVVLIALAAACSGV
jgi:hypothetical protein